MKFVDITGQRFGRLVVTQCRHGGDPKRVLCRCDCGRDFVVLKGSLTGSRPNTRSCGCLRRESSVARFTKHGARRTRPEYGVWCGMKKRCENPADGSYPDYGGRGIRVCDRWRNDFSAFFADMGPRPSPKHSIERSDNSRDYEPGNCLWATRAEQNANTRKNHYLTHNGETLHIAEWARRLGVARTLIQSRLSQGWSVDRILTTPPRPNVLITFNGETLPRSVWARRIGISEPALAYRLARGWPLSWALAPRP